MAKNNYLISQFKEMRKRIDSITPQVYAALALALHRKYGWGYTRINRLFKESQDIWEECVNNNSDMIKMCEDETGIDVEGK